ncbi:MAG: cytochrome c-type bioproteinis protein [Fusobacteria bacterium]|nr:MAG: cytochrome c-type bioproteinis protein [Fusobacteriota bacterium]KAF0229314.1 MAG: cytochrome c-type bioproteinis [Fusobacteriota bacterium]
MSFLITFIEGIVIFISPCMLPMLPIYFSYIIGQETENKSRKALFNSLGFVLGFTIIFVALGALAGSLGSFLIRYRTIVNIVSGLFIVFLGLNFMGVIKISFLNRTFKPQTKRKGSSFFSSVVLGIVFSIGWTPCVGPLLSSALLQASSSGNIWYGIFLLFTFSMGLGIPFVVSSILVDRLKNTFDFIKKHNRVINIVSGLFLVLVGILMMFGFFGYFLNLVSF